MTPVHDVRPTVYIAVVWPLIPLEFVAFLLTHNSPFFLLYGLATIVGVVVTGLTGALGLAEAIQNEIDTRRFRKQLEKAKVDS